jgi:hypothetical protein
VLALAPTQLNKIHRAGCHFILAFGAKDYVSVNCQDFEYVP